MEGEREGWEGEKTQRVRDFSARRRCTRDDEEDEEEDDEDEGVAWDSMKWAVPRATRVGW